MRAVLLPLLLAAAAGSTGAGAEVPPTWQRMVSDVDSARLRGWRDDWVAALAEPGATSLAAADPRLFDPDTALDHPVPPLGTYRCRSVRLGGGTDPRRSTRVETPQACRIEEDKGLARLVVEDGAQRAVGMIYPDSDARAVFLGTLSIGDERRALRYGRDRLRDMAGLVERVDERRWRVALPSPSFGGQLDLIELVPTGATASAPLPAAGSAATPARPCRAGRSASPAPGSPPPPPSDTIAASSSASGSRC